jgi:sulfoxide reductase catalytic subunit YedY
MVFFIIVHTVMVFITGLIGNFNHIVLGNDTESYWPLVVYVVAMVVITGLWLMASPFTLRYPGVVQAVGRATVGWASALMERLHPNATYSEKDISPHLWVNGTLPTSETYRLLQADNWRDFRLRIEGLVENPVNLTYNELHALPKHENITQHYCIQGWSGVAKWGGVRMSDILEVVRPLPSARWVVFYSFADGAGGPEEGRYYDCHKIRTCVNRHVCSPMK